MVTNPSNRCGGSDPVQGCKAEKGSPRAAMAAAQTADLYAFPGPGAIEDRKQGRA